MSDLAYAMELAIQAAADSPDPSTQNGAILVKDGSPIPCTAACNEFPEGLTHTPERWRRPLKYEFVEHAERNAIFKAAKWGVKTDRLTLVSPWAACPDCARAIIQSGVDCLVRLHFGDQGRWQQRIAVADLILSEANVEVIELEEPLSGALPPLRRNGSLWQPC